jgi:uronate dehydrogenase
MLATWLSYGDLLRLMLACLRTERVGYAVVWGVSNNADSFWRGDDRERLGWVPTDTADVYAAQLHDKVSGNPVVERFQGGAFCGIRYSRKDGENLSQ